MTKSVRRIELKSARFGLVCMALAAVGGSTTGSENRAVPEVTIPGIASSWFAPSIDGDWWRPPEVQKEWGWTKAALISDFVTREGKPAKDRTEVRLFYNAQHLYLAVTCFDSNMEAVRQAARKERKPAPMPVASPADSDLDWHANAFEVFIRPNPPASVRGGEGPGASPAFYQLAFNPAGHKFDQALGKEATPLWDGRWDVAVKLLGDRWQAEVPIEMASLAREGELRGMPTLGSHWEVTFCRASASNEWSSWGKDGWHHPENGRIVFGPKPPATVMPPVPHDENDLVVTEAESGNLEAGQGLFRATLLNPSKQEAKLEVSLSIGNLSEYGLVWARPEKWSREVTIGGGSKQVVSFHYQVKAGKEEKALTFTAKRKDLASPSYVAGVRFAPFPLSARLAELKQQLGRMRTEIQRLDPQGKLQGALAPAEAGYFRRFLSQLGGVEKQVALLERPGVDRATAVAKAKEVGEELNKMSVPFGNRLRPALYLLHRGIKRPSFAIGLSHPAVKVIPDDGFEGDFVGTVRLALARNEYETAQLVLLPLKTALPTVRVEVSPLVGPQGTRIEASEIELHRVGWVMVDEPSIPMRQGLWPDVLYPTDTFELSPLRPQPMMVTVHAPANQPAGVYRGTLHFSAKGSEPYRVTLEVEVYPFSLPERSPFHNEFWFCPIRAQAFYGEMTPELFEQFASLLGKYRCPIYPFHPGFVQNLVRAKQSADGKMSFDFSALEPYLRISFRNGLNRLNITFTNYWQHWGKGYSKWSDRELWEALQTGNIKEDQFFKQYLVAIAELLELKGYCTKEQMLFIGGDEPWGREVCEGMRPGYVMAKQALPSIKRTAAAARPGIEGLEDIIDIWCPQIREFDPKVYAKDKRELWMYTCVWKHPLPDFTVPAPGISPRMLYWVCRKFGVTGFLFWGTNTWASTSGEHWNKLWSAPRQEKPWVHDGWKPLGIYAPGDGYLVYPAPGGPIPSQRLVNIRDGVEDWLYLELLSQALSAAEKAGQIVPEDARRLAGVPDAMVKSIREWSKSAEALEATRSRIAQWVVKVGKQ